MFTRSKMIKLFTVFSVVFLLAACSEEGPMEKAGESIDNAATDTKNAIEDKCEAVKEGLNTEDTDC
ncbi:MAG: hypothetical protein ACSHXJ_10685 [Marinomonas colpomeniae]|jgi:predicted small lipoprotein YifL